MELIGNDIYLEIPTTASSILKSVLELCWKPPLVRATISDVFEELGIYVVQEEHSTKAQESLQITSYDCLNISNESRIGQGNYSTVYVLDFDNAKCIGRKMGQKVTKFFQPRVIKLLKDHGKTS